MAQTAEVRFSAFTIPEPNSGCLLWLGAISKSGYGNFWADGTIWRAHRWAYQHFVGPIPTGFTLDHKCRVRCCVNPDHLEPVTVKENVLRGIGHGARAARQTLCKSGHEFRPNRSKRGYRVCRTCDTERARERRRPA